LYYLRRAAGGVVSFLRSRRTRFVVGKGKGARVSSRGSGPFCLGLFVQGHCVLLAKLQKEEKMDVEWLSIVIAVVAVIALASWLTFFVV
jgi:hypothetical protein